MAIVSVSLNEKMLQEMDNIQNNMGFSGRSEVIRTGVRLLLEDYNSKKELKGNINSVLIIIHKQEHEDVISQVKHDYEDIIHTQIHNHIIDNRCLDIFIMKGEAEGIKDMTNLLQTSGKMEYLKLVVT